MTARRTIVSMIAFAMLIPAAVAVAYNSSQKIVSSGPLTRVEITDLLNCGVAHVNDEDPEFYRDFACGTFVSVGEQLFGPANVPAGGMSNRTAFTPVSQSAVTGEGTQESPFRIVTEVRLGDTGLSIRETDSYVVGTELYRTDVRIYNSGAARDVIVYRAGDCYLQESDDGYGRAGPGGAIACIGVDPQTGGPSPRIEQWRPVTPGSSYYEAGYSEVWSWINSRRPFPNTCECDQLQDNGAGLSWSVNVPAGGETTVSHSLLFSPEGAEPPAEEGPVDRPAGADRIETAVQVSRTSFPAPPADVVVLARSDTYPDALAGAPLARLLDAPILLTPTGSLHPTTRDEINRLQSTRAVLLGGEAALSDQVRQDLLAQTGVRSVDRVFGPSRFDTAAEIARTLESTVGVTSAYVAEGIDADARRGWPDALAVSTLAAHQLRPILLVDTDTLPEPTRAVLREIGVADARIVGGPAAVSSTVETAIRNEGVTVERTSGGSRFETARAVVDLAIAAGLSPATTWIASGANFPDALVGGPAAAKSVGILMLTAPDDLANSPPTSEYVTTYKGQITQIYIMGGTTAVSQRVEDQIEAILAS